MLGKKNKNKEVIEFLKKNPNFFIDQPLVLDQLNFPKFLNINKEKKVISFKDWIINKLRQQKKKLIENAEYNYLTQKKIHIAVTEVLKKKNKKDFFSYINKDLPIYFQLELINIVLSNRPLCEKNNLIFLDIDKAQKIYSSKNHFIMDAVENKIDLYKELKKKIVSNAIFSLDIPKLKSFPLLVFGSNDKHFVSNRAYDLILFFSKIVEYKLQELFK